ncbi:SDR family NAD(P)-dependent oxidoreductase [Methylobacterium oryzihabitans]|uniref:SDR family oxidoreductase n=1 Tax=Methylobacterium oryzihabitans TaxID=2499852 RepID=A0A3S2V998_9HYPH|nr:SDR family oxidoreductase [Methylobacterium oryzihabitans]RVU17553.1 SDR family oxidoreductase [Methylobacterium oryzihabitans]
MDLGLADKVCLVTGASTGIGRATALELAREGARVVVAARNREALETLAAEIERAGHPAPVRLTADLTAADGPRALASAALSACARVDVLVNNAGGSRPLARADDEAAWEESFLLNFTAARRLTDALAPAMLDRGWGRIVNVSGALIAKALNAASPAKAALESWSKAAAAAYASRGVTVNCIAPGRINTPQILDRLHPTEEARRAFIDANIPAGRFGEPEEAAALIAFLASERASFITGAAVPVDGGSLRLAF